MTLVGKAQNHTINEHGGGPYTFILEGQPPRYTQLYIHDSNIALQYHMQNNDNCLDCIVLSTLQNMLENLHPSVQLYKQAYILTHNMPSEVQCRIALHFQENTNRYYYNDPLPSAREIAVILPGDRDTPSDCQDIILFRKDNTYQRIHDSHPFYPSLYYVLLFPTGQFQWHSRIPYNGQED